MTVVLAYLALHGFLQELTWVELRSALMLLAMTVIALPLLPDQALDPWGALSLFALASDDHHRGAVVRRLRGHPAHGIEPRCARGSSRRARLLQR